MRNLFNLKISENWLKIQSNWYKLGITSLGYRVFPRLFTHGGDLSPYGGDKCRGTKR